MNRGQILGLAAVAIALGSVSAFGGEKPRARQFIVDPVLGEIAVCSSAARIRTQRLVQLADTAPRAPSDLISERANLDRARRLILTPRRLNVTLSEHQKVLDGIIAGDAARASAAMRAHIDSVMAELIAFAADHHELFADGDLLQEDPAYSAFPFG